MAKTISEKIDDLKNGVEWFYSDEFKLEEAECVFIDDAPINVAAAVACGWQGIVFHGDPAELEEKLKAIGVRC